MKTSYYFAISAAGWVVYKGTFKEIATGCVNCTIWETKHPVKSPLPQQFHRTQCRQIPYGQIPQS